MKLVKTLQGIAGSSGISVRRQAPQSTQRAFFDAIAPVTTEHALVRFGDAGDGGYLVPDDLEGIEACFSPGVDLVATFERDMLGLGMRTFQIDASVEASPLSDPRNDFERKFLGIETEGDNVTLEDWVARKLPGSTGDLLLQMDIEGYEWTTLAHASEATLRRFRVMVIEFHALELVFDHYGSTILLPVLQKLNRLFDIVHIHPNNAFPLVRSKYFEVPSLLEMTFLRKDRSKVCRPGVQVPHPLDSDNVPGQPPVVVPISLLS